MRYATDDGGAFDVLAPEEPLLADGPNDVNENSVVLKMTYRCSSSSHVFRLLFTGDAGAQSEARMLANRDDLYADVPAFSKSAITVRPTCPHRGSSPPCDHVTRS